MQKIIIYLRAFDHHDVGHGAFANTVRDSHSTASTAMDRERSQIIYALVASQHGTVKWRESILISQCHQQRVASDLVHINLPSQI